ncbi:MULTISPECIES: DUF4225 domain-containing protein [unclassified Gilliamella]|uniref:DUF4225 domain-containing protein n=1 Tax=unclassified Gilliamella TaxID=2685620 RepID=UPI002269BFB3|nr:MULTISPECIES: DUF4225 domain-containing protein [unclassified Gilliamella]MCX8602059.1 DUF4225 domain-containing protein [Gilliamella sp. B3722]MCX8607780.1 DUF4225 domain-containing protein [Gilliamella sp. B3771]MCX8611329.1 DUF4225 domain-containing protein [Gilliamella sp. B3891]MCX8613901.1 DUF4225 domain-containing protein [Gilliamella sp. B3773]MCX8615969.1 DUF4225 domain-containing protein [Gilliamella sp. B3770]
MSKKIAVIGDDTTTGGKVISSSVLGFNHIDAIACLGDYASCPKCKGSGKIIEATDKLIVEGKPAAYDGCIIACGCRPIGVNRIIATKSLIFVDVTASYYTNKSNPINNAFSTIAQNDIHTQIKSLVASNEDKTKIRLDAQNLLNCAHEVCEKHLYHDDIKQDFIDDIDNFASNIVNQVESGAMSYEQGSEAIKSEEKSLLDQSIHWALRGLNVLGGAGLMVTGIAMCTTGVGFILGSYIAAHGANSIYEGITDEDGFIKSVYQDAAVRLGMSKEAGSLAYDLVDIGLSVHGKLKLVPKIDKSFAINQYNRTNPAKFKLFHYGRKDLTQAYRQMNKWLLSSEIMSDSLSLYEIYQEAENILVKDKENGDTNLYISNPEQIDNIEKIVDNCAIVVRITGRESDIDDQSNYSLCTRLDGTTYRQYFDGHIEEGSME